MKLENKKESELSNAVVPIPVYSTGDLADDLPCSCGKTGCSFGITGGRKWCDVDSVSSLGDFQCLGYEEKVVIFTRSYNEDYFERSPLDWEFMWRSIYVDMCHIERYVNCTQEWCESELRFVHKCICDRPLWDDSAEFSRFISPSKAFGYFQELLLNIHEHAQCRLPVGLANKVLTLTPEDFFLAFVERSNGYPLAFRWAAYKAYALCLPRGGDMFNWFYPLVNEMENDLRDNCFIVGRAEGVVEDVLLYSRDLFTTVLGFCVKIGEETVDIWSDVLRSLLASAVKAPQDLFVNFRERFADALLQSFKERAIRGFEVFKKYVMHPLFTLSIKTIVRWWMGYSIKSMVLEVFWDRDLYGHIPDVMNMLMDLAVGAKQKAEEVVAKAVVGDVFASFGHSSELDYLNVLAEGVDDSAMITMVLTVALGALGCIGQKYPVSSFSYLSSLCRETYTAASLLDKLGVKESVNKLMCYVKGVQVGDEERIRFEAKYPRTMTFVEAHVDYAAKSSPNNSDKAHIKHRYAEFLRERAKWDPRDATRLGQLSSPATHCATQLGATAHYQFRRAPAFFLFQGPPGIGKSSIVEAALNTIAAKEDPKRNFADAIYTVCVGDDYCSGYVNQEIWKFDDMFQTVDSATRPAGDIGLMFQLSTTAPFTLNMAALEDKGKVARCYLGAGSTNLNFFKTLDGIPLDPEKLMQYFRKHVESIKEVGALRRRLTYCVLPVVQAPYAYDTSSHCIVDGKGRSIRDQKVDRSKLYKFYVLSTDNRLMPIPGVLEGNHETCYAFSWKQLLNLMWKEYCLSRDYDPEEDQSLNADVDLIEDDVLEGEGEGFFDQLLTDSPAVRLACAGGMVAGLGLVLTVRPSDPVKCACGQNTFFPNRECCEFEAKYRATHNLEQLGGEWRTTRCFDLKTGFEQAGTYRSRHPTNVIKYNYIEMEDFGSSYHVTAVDLNELQTFLKTSADRQQRVILRITHEYPIAYGDIDLKPGLYSFQAWYEYNMTEVHVGHIGEDKWFSYKYMALAWAPFVGGIIAAGIAKALTWKNEKVSDEDDVVVMKDGEPLFLNPDTQQYEPQAPMSTRARVFKNGKWYYKVKSNNGDFEWYAQSPEDNPFVTLLGKSQRLFNQVPSLKDSLWAIVREEDETLMGNVFAIDAKRVMCPLHVAKILETQLGLVLRRESEVRKVCPNFGTEKNLTVKQVGDDVAIVEFYVTKLPEQPAVIYPFTKCRDHVTKFVQDDAPLSGNCSLLHRNAKGRIEVTSGVFSNTSNPGVSYAHNDVVYEVKGKSVRLAQLVSSPGWCGGLYVDNNPNTEKTCLGIHVARGKEPHDFAMMHVVTEKMLSVDSDTIPTGHIYLQGYGEAYHIFVEQGINTTGVSAHPPLRSIHGRNSKKVKTMFHETFKCPYELAKLRICEAPDGTVYDPWKVAMKKLGARVTEPLVGEAGLLETVYALVNDYSPHFDPKELPTWAEVVSYDTGLPSVSKKTSAGDPYYAWGGLKGTAFMKGCELNTLTPEYKEFLEWLDDSICPSDWVTRRPCDFPVVESVCNGDIKDEPRLTEKSWKPRLYTVVNMHEFLMQRRYFADIAAAFCQNNVVFSSALGVSPDDFDVFQLHLQEAGVDALILALDHEHMDGHVKARFMRLVSLFLVLLARASDKFGRNVDPLFPKLSRRGFVMWRLMQRLAWFIMKVGDTLAEIGAMHPSGSFLTAMINHIVQEILICWVLSQLFEIGIDVTVREIKRVLLGDDSLVAIPRKYANKIDVKKIKELFARQGFSVTGSDKDPEIKLHRLWQPEDGEMSQYTFLSRRFALVSVHGSNEKSVVGLLEPEKVEKIICFTEKKKYEANFPEQVIAMVQEIERYDRCNYLDARLFVKKMERELDLIRPGFLAAAFSIIRTQGDYSVIKMMVLAFMGVNAVIQCRAESGEGSEMSGLTGFVSDVVSDNVASRDEGLEDWRYSGMESGEHVDRNVFSTPYACHEFTWDINTDELLMEKTVPSMYFDGNVNAQMKLSNFAFLRAVAVVKVIINGSPYVAGKLLLSGRPLGRSVADEWEASGDPCVEIDAASGKEAELRLPCIIPHGWSLVEYYQQEVVGSRDYFNWGYFNLTVLSPLLSVGGTGSVYGRVYCWLEDVELQGPTVTNFVLSAQAPPAKSKVAGKGEDKRGAMFMKSGRVDPFSVKMAGMRPTEASQGSGFIDTTIAPVVRSVGGVIADVGAAALTIAKVAALAGLSVPQQDPSVIVTSNAVSNPDTCHVVGKFTGVHLAAHQQQRVTLPEGVFDMSGDEMDINKFCSRMGLLTKFNWEVVDGTDDIIFSIPVNPGCVHNEGGYEHNSPLSFAASMFRFWRGSIKYRFAIAKTKFHSGALEIVLTMGAGRLNVDTETRASRCYRKVWNVNEMSSIEIEVPFCSATLWSPVKRWNAFGLGGLQFAPSPYCTTGKLSVRVVNPLVNAGGTVNDLVNIVVYTGGGDDLEFSVPFFKSAGLSLTPGPVEGVVEAEAEVGGGVYQDDETVGVESLEVEGMCPVYPVSKAGNVMCVGEAIKNFRLLTRMFSVNSVSKTVASGYVRFFWRDVVNSHQVIAFLMSAFAFGTGGFRVETWQTPTANTYWAVSLFGGYSLGGAPGVIYDPSRAATFTFSAPYYEPVPYLPVAQFNAGANQAQWARYGPSVSVAFAGAGNIGFRTAGADDFTLGWQIGIPPSLAPDTAASVEVEFAQYSTTVT